MDIQAIYEALTAFIKALSELIYNVKLDKITDLENFGNWLGDLAGKLGE